MRLHSRSDDMNVTVTGDDADMAKNNEDTLDV